MIDRHQFPWLTASIVPIHATRAQLQWLIICNTWTIRVHHLASCPLDFKPEKIIIQDSFSPYNLNYVIIVFSFKSNFFFYISIKIYFESRSISWILISIVNLKVYRWSFLSCLKLTVSKIQLVLKFQKLPFCPQTSIGSGSRKRIFTFTRTNIFVVSMFTLQVSGP